MTVVEGSSESGRYDPEPVEVTTSWIGAVAVVSFTGTLDMRTTPQLMRALEAVISQRPPAVIADLSSVDFMASAGMTVLITADEQCSAHTRFGVVTPDAITSRPMRLIGLHDFVSMFETMDEAISALGGDDLPEQDQTGSAAPPPEPAPN
ncbi:STAS domain-containing protein [Mycolicibacterium sp. P1-5]|uniref:STAS domain-containing protein n=1 Tax=Mycolicibacterium sp. P1-5 TaxID=2024617 RepID=UPI0018831E63|nr:STAS domain-containing protein [Mycolicibacterium sp. P1-5]